MQRGALIYHHFIFINGYSKIDFRNHKDIKENMKIVKFALIFSFQHHHPLPNNGGNGWFKNSTVSMALQPNEQCNRTVQLQLKHKQIVYREQTITTSAVLNDSKLMMHLPNLERGAAQMLNMLSFTSCSLSFKMMHSFHIFSAL